MALDSAQDTLSGVLVEISERGLGAYMDWALAECCALYALAGDWDQAFIYAKQVLQSREGKSLLPMNFTGYFETEALLRGGAKNLALVEVERLSKLIGNNRRYQIVWLRSMAVIAQWEQNQGQAISYLQDALELAQEIGLPGEEWSILGILSDLYSQIGDRDRARKAHSASAAILQGLADSFAQSDLRDGFLAAETVRRFMDVS